MLLMFVEQHIRMIKILKLNNSEPYKVFDKHYQDALSSGEQHVEAISVSSLNKNKLEVDSRYVNLKYINDDEWIFFSNYQSQKAYQFESHDQVAVTIFWKSTYVQVRMLAKITKSSKNFSDKHFLNRDDKKNALAVSSNQSKPVDSYDEVLKNYNDTLNNQKILKNRPDYWGGYSFKPFSFEFWEGNTYRLNRRQKFTYSKNEDVWNKCFLQP